MGLPGHFVVRVQTPARGAARGSVPRRHAAHREGLPAAARPHLRRQVKIEPRMLRPCGRKDMIERMLRNLKAIHLRDEDTLARAARGRPAGPPRSPAAPRTCATAGSSTPRSTATASPRATSRPTWRSPAGEGRRRARGARGRSSSSRPHASIEEDRIMTTVTAAVSTRSRSTWAATRAPSSTTPARASRRPACTCPAPTAWTRPTRAPTGRRRCCATCRRSSTTAASPAPATSRSCRSTRASSTRRARRSPRTRCTSTPRTS